MRPRSLPLRTKSTSLPAFRSRLYSKLKHNPSHEQWKLFLHQQLDLQSTIKELSRADFDVSSQNQHKISVRQNFKIKKEIVFHLESNNIPAALNKLDHLKEKLAAINQEGNVLQMIVYVESRQQIQNGLKNGSEDGLINMIKEKVAPFVWDNNILMAKIRTMSLLSILLLRFHGILMSAQQRGLLVRTIELKKKKMLQIDSKSQRDQQFQCLIYLLLELYKILYLLKSDQQTIQHYYNQLNAYYELYTEKNQHKYLDLRQTEKILADMKPVLNDLNIYQDSKIRKQLAGHHIKEEIIEKEEQKYCRRSIKQSSVFPSDKSQSTLLKLGSRKQSKRKILRLTSIANNSIEENFNKKKYLNLQQPTSLNINIVEEPEQVHLLTKDEIILSFLLPLREKIFIIELSILYRDGFGLIDLNLLVKSQSFLQERYKIKGIKNILQRIQVAAVDRWIEKIFLKLFGQHEKGQFKQLHNLIVNQRQIPKRLEGIATGMMRIKAIVKEYIRRNYQQEYLMGKKIVFPNIKVHQLNQSLEKEAKQTEFRRQRANYSKRVAMVHKDSSPPSIDDTMFVKCIIRHELTQQVIQFVFNAYFGSYFKGLDVHHFQNYDHDQPDMSCFLSKLKSIAKQAYQEHKLVKRAKVVNQMLKLQHKQEKVGFQIVQYKIQEELQLSQKIQPSIIQMKIFNQIKKKSERKKQRPLLQVIKTKKDQYEVFNKHVEGKYITYSNDKSIIHVPASISNSSLKLQRKRVRMYNSIKLGCTKGDGLRNIKTSKKKNSIVTSEQDIVLLFNKHFIVRNNKKGYTIINQYSCPEGDFLYEIIVSPSLRFFSRRYKKIQTIVHQDMDLQKKILCGETLNKYVGGRQPISEANHYYLQSFN